MPEPAMPALPPLRAVIERHGLVARRALGQNFLLDPGLLARIARAAGELDRADVVEVGAGPGGLTRALLAAGARRVVAVEKDERCVAALRELQAAAGARLTVVPGDALDLRPADLADAPIHIAGNLPFNVATPLLFGWLAEAERYAGMTLMFQREVADRLTAAPGSKDYGRLAVMAQWRCAVRRLFDVSPGAFLPPPKVTASVVSLVPRPEPLAPAAAEALSRVVAAAFGQRRKMLRSALKVLGPESGALLAAAGLTPTARAEEIDVAGFCALARAWDARRRSA